LESTSWKKKTTYFSKGSFSKDHYPKLLTNSHDPRRNLTLYCNVGKAIITKKGDIKGYGTVWFYPEGIANISTLSNVQRKHRVTYNSTLDEGFLVFKADGTARSFRPSEKGLFFSDVKSGTTHMFINTVDNNKTKYTIKEYSDAVRTQSLQNFIGRPSTNNFNKYMA